MKRIPVILLTGFLGSGKTTYLNKLLSRESFSNSLVIVNEFGEVPVDHLLIEQATETIFEMSNGCLCCSIKGELVETLARLELGSFDRIFIETTGIADPLPVFQALTADPQVSSKLVPSQIITAFDATRGMDLIHAHEEAARQLVIADKIILTKQDIHSAKAALLSEIAAFNPTAEILPSDVEITQSDLEKPSADKPDIKPLHKHSKFHSTVMTSDRIIGLHDLAGMLHLMIGQLGSSLLRIKGFAKITEHETPVIVQVSGQIVHDFAPASADLNNPDQTSLVIITKDDTPDHAIEIFNGFFGELSTQGADRDALMDNPLSIPGM